MAFISSASYVVASGGTTGDHHCCRHHLLPHRPLSLLVFSSPIFTGRLLRLLHSRRWFQNPNPTFDLVQSLHKPYVRIQTLHSPQLFQNLCLQRTTAGLVGTAISNGLIAMRKIRRRGRLMRQKRNRKMDRDSQIGLNVTALDPSTVASEVWYGKESGNYSMKMMGVSTEASDSRNKKNMINSGIHENKNNVKEKRQLKTALFVKLNMDGIPIGRKVDLNAHKHWRICSVDPPQLSVKFIGEMENMVK
ncbi:hypothetical protein HYC85_016760 [Camellia sinensis]|uniref:Auxin-responsive protein n=1 Tax=Camellia sinensis TaxID=4442 RepID=A0A7J7H0I7_CAMSI|nr:hypothetical protein HYC85_016760 [Camellia sinensis]